MKKSLITVACSSLLLAASIASAATADQKCQSGKAKALGKYEFCVANAMSKTYKVSNIDTEAFYKCADALNAAWVKLQKFSDASGCSSVDRFVDNGITFTDQMTGLIWLKLTAFDFNQNYTDRTDADNAYSLNFDGNDDGSA
jgi:hypothetical protein